MFYKIHILDLKEHKHIYHYLIWIQYYISYKRLLLVLTTFLQGTLYNEILMVHNSRYCMEYMMMTLERKMIPQNKANMKMRLLRNKSQQNMAGKLIQKTQCYLSLYLQGREYNYLNLNMD